MTRLRRLVLPCLPPAGSASSTRELVSPSGDSCAIGRTAGTGGRTVLNDHHSLRARALPTIQDSADLGAMLLGPVPPRLSGTLKADNYTAAHCVAQIAKYPTTRSCTPGPKLSLNLHANMRKTDVRSAPTRRRPRLRFGDRRRQSGRGDVRQARDHQLEVCTLVPPSTRHASSGLSISIPLTRRTMSPTQMELLDSSSETPTTHSWFESVASSVTGNGDSMVALAATPQLLAEPLTQGGRNTKSSMVSLALAWLNDQDTAFALSIF